MVGEPKTHKSAGRKELGVSKLASKEGAFRSFSSERTSQIEFIATFGYAFFKVGPPKMFLLFFFPSGFPSNPPQNMVRRTHMACLPWTGLRV